MMTFSAFALTAFGILILGVKILLGLSLLIFVHELGHFLVAKFFSVQVLEFAIGFGPIVYRKQWGETQYAIRAVPLGGFVRMAGDTVEDLENDISDLPEGVTSDKSRWFLTQRFWPKFLIVLAGPMFNLFFALFLAIGALLCFGKPELLETAEIGGFLDELPAATSGLELGDVVTSINEKEIITWEDLSETVQASGGNELTFTVQRAGESFQYTIQPTKEETELDAIIGDGEQEPTYKIGVIPATERVPIGFVDAFRLGGLQVYFITELTLKGLVGMVTGRVSTKHIAGPIFIFKKGGEAAKSGIDRLVDFLVFLSVSLALLNLLPIPVLDGGHLVFFTLEALRGSPLNTNFQERATQVGMFFLLLLMVFAVTNDVRRILEPFFQ